MWVEGTSSGCGLPRAWPVILAWAMAQENIKALGNAYAAFNEGDWGAALELADLEIEWRLHGNLSLDAEQRIHGREAVRMLWADFFGVWDEYKMETLDIVEAPDGRVVVPVRFTAKGQGSGVPIEMAQFHVWRFRDGRTTAVDVYDDRHAAFEAAGLRE
jgi:ketosteroid isomerase-like protein